MGLQRGKSCHANLVAAYDDVSNSVEREGAVHVAYRDLSKAFSGLHHNSRVQLLEIPKRKASVFLNVFAKVC